MNEPKSMRRFLLPLVPLYRMALSHHQRQLRSHPPSKLIWPVLSIGNLSTGGAGKTPLTIALARALNQRGLHVDVLSRGYGRRSKATLRVDPKGPASLYGDEPLLIAREAKVPVYVAPQRYDAGQLAEQMKGTGFSPYIDDPKNEGAGREGFQPLHSSPEGSSSPSAIHILDDGFQHRQLHRDIDILLLTTRDLHDRLLPAGNLREPLAAFRRAHILAIPADEPEVEEALEEANYTGPLWRLHRTMTVPPVTGPVVAFCGIAQPEQFFAGLAKSGLNLASRIAFRDHHPYVPHDLDCLRDACNSVKATAILTTDKDRVRLGSLAASIPIPLLTAKLTIQIEDEPNSIDWLVAHIQ